MPKKIVCTPCESSLSIADQIKAINHAMKVKELALMLDMSPTKLYNLAREGRIPSYRIAGSIRFDPHAAAEWLRARECKVA